MAFLFASIALLPPLMNRSIAPTVTPCPLSSASSTAPSISWLSGTDRWTEKHSIGPSSPSWTKPFYNTTSSCCSPISSNISITSSAAMTRHETKPSRPTSTVIVGAEGDLAFSPSTVNAEKGTIISFDFLKLNHTLTQSQFSDPCRSDGGFDTGFRQFNPANVSGMFVLEFEVDTLEPQWFFCAQTLNTSHCHAGMVFSLNSRGGHKQFLHNALEAVTTASKKTSGSACYLTSSIVPIGTTGLPSSTGHAIFNLSSLEPTPTAIITPIVNGAGTITVHTLVLFIISVVFI